MYHANHYFEFDFILTHNKIIDSFIYYIFHIFTRALDHVHLVVITKSVRNYLRIQLDQNGKAVDGLTARLNFKWCDE